MGVLQSKLTDDGVRKVVIQDCVKVVDAEVAGKKGMTGMVIKGGYRTFKAIRPSIVQEAVVHLLDDFSEVLDRLYDEYRAEEPDGTGSFEQWALQRDVRVADDLLGITDSMMDRSSKTVLKKIYGGLRAVAQKNVAQAVPAVARLVTKHAG